MRHLMLMQWLRVILFFALAASTAWAQVDQFQFRNPTRSLGAKKHTRARIVLSHDAAKPGDTVLAGVELTMDKGWHTYWSNPGESGQATEIHWNLPAGLAAGEIQWPVPEKFVSPDELKLTTYVFHDRAVLLVPLKIATDAAAGERDLSALVKWLECEVACVPGSNTVRGTLVITNESRLSSDTNFFAEAQQRLPAKTLPGTASAKWDAPAGSAKRAFLVEWIASATEPDFFPYTNALATISAKTIVATASSAQALLRKTAERTGADWPKEVTGLLVRKEGDRVAGYEVTLPFAEGPTRGGAMSSKSIWVWLLYAFIGGLILNIMPCVLPVIALKILGFVNQSRETPGRVKTLGLLYTLGVVVSFLVLAGIVIGVKAAGQKAGWGLQFSNPYFIVVLTVIVMLVALNLFGVFEITLSGGAMSAAGAASSRHGNAGAFMNGVLATVLATPCTAPFLGASLGFAFAQPAHMIVLFFIVIALGLASPYLLLSWNPRWLKFLPKPGAWMERFKIAMGFPMLATALWLLNLTTTFYGDRAWWLGVFLVFVGAAAWMFGTFVQRGGVRRMLALVVTLLLLGAGYAWALEAELRWRSPGVNEENTPGLALAPKGYPWQVWSPESLAKARTNGRPVIVDFTAKWCQTCNTIVKPALGSESVRAKLKEVDAIALLADYTKFPSVISEELEKHERAGVPLVLVYPKDASKPPLVLSEALTPREVVEALEEAAE